VKNSSSSIEECLGIMAHISHNTYKLVDSNRLIDTTPGILINYLNDKDERIITLN
jgi:hypothetical protein